MEPGLESNKERLMNRGIVAAGLLSALVSIFTIGLRPAAAQDAGSVRGTVVDQLGGVVAGAQVALVRDAAQPPEPARAQTSRLLTVPQPAVPR